VISISVGVVSLTLAGRRGTDIYQPYSNLR
jgi:hypothetical protein